MEESHIEKSLEESQGPSASAARFEAFPPEVRNEMYRYLLSTKACKVIRSRHYSTVYSYQFHTDILRTSNIISQEAHGVLYKDNLLILLEFGNVSFGYNNVALNSGVDFNYTPRGVQLPAFPIRI